MPSLRELQQAVQRGLVDGKGLDAVPHIVRDGLAPRQRLGIYRNNFVGTLTKALGLSFPAVHRLVGSEFFEGATQVFMQELPPRSAWLDTYGVEFPDFLQHFAPASGLVYLADVARLEWAVSWALHVPDAQPLDATRLAGVVQSDHGRGCFVPHPSLSTLQSDFPVDAIWRAVLDQDEAAMAAIDLGDGPVRLVVQRLANGVDVARLDEGAWRFLAALCAGQPLSAVLAASAGVDAPALLAEYLTSGRFIAFHLECRLNENEREENIR